MEEAELYLLHRHLGVDPEYAWFELPDWAYDLLLKGLLRDLQRAGQQAPARR